jgi:hypothetical protein
MEIESRTKGGASRPFLMPKNHQPERAIALALGAQLQPLKKVKAQRTDSKSLKTATL